MAEGGPHGPARGTDAEGLSGASDMNRPAPVFESVVGSTMRPGDRGTAKLARDWGDRLVTVRYRWEGDLREKIRAAGGRFVLKAMRWRIRYDTAIALGLEDRVSFLVLRAPKTSPGSPPSPATPKSSTAVGTRKSLPAQTFGRNKGKRP